MLWREGFCDEGPGAFEADEASGHAGGVDELVDGFFGPCLFECVEVFVGEAPDVIGDEVDEGGEFRGQVLRLGGAWDAKGRAQAGVDGPAQGGWRVAFLLTDGLQDLLHIRRQPRPHRWVFFP